MVCGRKTCEHLMVDSGHVAPRNDRFCTTTWSREWNHVFGTIYRRWRTSFGWDLKQAAKHSQNSTGWRTPQLPADQEHQLPVFCADDQRHQSLWRHKNHSMALYVIDVYGTVCWFVFFFQCNVSSGLKNPRIYWLRLSPKYRYTAGALWKKAPRSTHCETRPSPPCCHKAKSLGRLGPVSQWTS